MQFRQKLAYMALGGVLVLAGHVLPGLVVGSATAQSGLQDAEFDTITARKVVVRGLGDGVAMLSAEEGGVSLILLSSGGIGNVGIFATDKEATFMAQHKEGKTRVGAQARSDGAHVDVYREETQLAFIGVDVDGGIVRVSDKYGKPKAAMMVGENGDGFVYP